MRPSWDVFFLAMARTVATRATCPRLSVGAVIVRDRAVLSVGYNGAVAGARHCTEDGCDLVEGHCTRAVHAEANAIAQAAKHGTRVEGGTIYTTHSPCWRCSQLIANAGLVRVVYGEGYGAIWPAGRAQVLSLIEAEAEALGLNDLPF